MEALKYGWERAKRHWGLFLAIGVTHIVIQAVFVGILYLVAPEQFNDSVGQEMLFMGGNLVGSTVVHEDDSDTANSFDSSGKEKGAIDKDIFSAIASETWAIGDTYELIATLGQWVIELLLLGGLLMIILKIARDEPVRYSELFGNARYALSLLWGTIIYTTIISFSFFPLIFFVGTIFYLFLTTDINAFFTSVVFYFFVTLVVSVPFFVLSIVWGIKYSLYAYLIVDKGLGGWAAIVRSGEITNGAKWSLFKFAFVVALLTTFVFSVVFAPVLLVVFSSALGNPLLVFGYAGFVIGLVITGILLIIALLFLIPTIYIAMAYIYRKLLFLAEMKEEKSVDLLALGGDGK